MDKLKEIFADPRNVKIVASAAGAIFGSLIVAIGFKINDSIKDPLFVPQVEEVIPVVE